MEEAPQNYLSDYMPLQPRKQITLKVITIIIKRTSNLHTYEHSGTSATHISFDMSCRSHPSISALAWFRYERCRILSPLPHVTEHALHSEYSVTLHSATSTQLFHIFISTPAIENNYLSAAYVLYIYIYIGSLLKKVQLSLQQAMGA
jgi:hypothetical protein